MTQAPQHRRASEWADADGALSAAWRADVVLLDCSPKVRAARLRTPGQGELPLLTIRRMRQRSVSVPASLLLIAAGVSGGGRPTPASIPAPLAAALIDDRGSPGRATPEFTVGTLPRGYPAALVPPGPVRIVGGMTAGDQITVIFADSTRRLAAVLEQHFEQVGFTRPAPSPRSGFSSRSGPYSFFCKDSATVSAEPLTGSERHLARVSYRRVRGHSPCARFEPEPPQDDLRLPPLTPPPGVHVRRGGASSVGGEVTSQAELSGTALVPSAIVAHYAAQLVAAGWTPSEPAISARVAAQFFEAKDAAGATWEGVLVAAGSETALKVKLNMQRRTRP